MKKIFLFLSILFVLIMSGCEVGGELKPQSEVDCTVTPNHVDCDVIDDVDCTVSPNHADCDIVDDIDCTVSPNHADCDIVDDIDCTVTPNHADCDVVDDVDCIITPNHADCSFDKVNCIVNPEHTYCMEIVEYCVVNPEDVDCIATDEICLFNPVLLCELYDYSLPDYLVDLNLDDYEIAKFEILDALGVYPSSYSEIIVEESTIADNIRSVLASIEGVTYHKGTFLGEGPILRVYFSSAEHAFEVEFFKNGSLDGFRAILFHFGDGAENSHIYIDDEFETELQTIFDLVQKFIPQVPTS